MITAIKLFQKQIEIANTIKILIYKENRTLLDKVNFEDDDTFLEPLLFAYFNKKKTEDTINLQNILQGFFSEKSDIILKEEVDKQYIPRIGYFKNNQQIGNCYYLRNTKIELLKDNLKILDSFFQSPEGTKINSNDIEINTQLLNKYLPTLENALSIIKKSIPEHFELIEIVCKKIFLFKADPYNTNSFATINAHGIAFLNVYQEDYNEVFFVDDIAHQTGHIILTTLFFNRKEIFKIDENQNIGNILNNGDYRNFYTLIHALYTYYTTFKCLDKCLDKNFFQNVKKSEAIARIGFYLKKCEVDLTYFEKFVETYDGIEKVLTQDAIFLYNDIKSLFKQITEKYKPVISTINYKNQPYNFTYSIFVQNNA